MRQLIEIGGYSVSAYSLCAALAAILGASLALPALKRTGLSLRRALLLLFEMCVAFLIGARLWNVSVNPGNYAGALQWYSLRLTGLSLYGGMLGAFAALACKFFVWKRSLWPVLDAFVIPSGAAFCIARIGCFLNGCCAGRATSSCLGVVFPSKARYQQALADLSPFFRTNYAVHPTQLYELLGAAVGLPLAICLSKRLRLRSGGQFLLYSAWFSAVRLVALPLRALTYPTGVKDVLYPTVYISIILTALTVLIIRRRAGQRHGIIERTLHHSEY